jgi:F-type H+-transporting ATPase subunit delta
MADSSTESRPYAIAAFKQASEENQVSQWSDMLALLEQVVGDTTMKGAIANPRVNREQLAALIIDVCGDVLSDTGKNFVRLLAEYGRLHSVTEIRGIFEQQRAELEGRSRVHVRSAYELDDTQCEIIQQSMAKRLGGEVDLTVEVDDTLIGGLVIRAGDTVIDATLRGRLTQLRQTLL